MNPIKKAIAILMFILPVALLLSCVGDDEHGETANEDFGKVSVEIALPSPSKIQTSVRSSSHRTDYNTLNDVNLIAYHKDGTVSIIYYGGSSEELSSQNNIVIKYDFDKTIGQIALVGNFGSKIPAAEAGNYIETLRARTVTIDNSNIPVGCLMYAEATPTGIINGRMQMRAEMVRSLAMVTVSMESASLKEGLSIKPVKIGIRNVPRFSHFIKDNKANATNIRAEGYSIDNINWGVLSGSNMSIGADNHQTTGGGDALFLFENKQGNKGGADQTKKEAKDDMQYASYIEIEAEYDYTENSTKYYGTIVYRFCLGSNATNNYDVIRNHHYAVTLKLSDWGGAKEGGYVENGKIVIPVGTPETSWRVAVNLDEWQSTDEIIDLDSHLVYGELKLNNISGTCEIDNVDWLWIWDGSGWVTPDQITSVDGKKLLYLTNPWRAEEADFPQSDDGKQYRDCEIVAMDAKGKKMAIFTLRQWAPVKIAHNLYMERFESDDNDNSIKNILRAKWGLTLEAFGVNDNYSTNGDADGWNNTRYFGNISVIDNKDNPIACWYALYKGGNKIGTDDLPPVSVLPPDFVTAKYYLPNVEELQLMGQKKDNPNNENNRYEPLDNSVYWSCIPTMVTFLTKYYVNGYIYDDDRTKKYKVRTVYRPEQ